MGRGRLTQQPYSSYIRSSLLRFNIVADDWDRWALVFLRSKVSLGQRVREQDKAGKDTRRPETNVTHDRVGT